MCLLGAILDLTGNPTTLEEQGPDLLVAVDIGRGVSGKALRHASVGDGDGDGDGSGTQDE